MMEIKTERLRLIPLNLENLELMAKDRASMEKNLGLNPIGVLLVPEEIRGEIAGALKWWIKFVRENPSLYYWGTNWEVVLEEENRSIGGIGLSGLPDENGKVVVGYSIDERYQSRGFATEALQGLAHWALSHPQLKKITALTPVDNIASQRVLEKNGFTYVAEVEEEGIKCFLWETGWQ
jgi:[ribosomal protein S5]-alanine N-acetyltransferase